jgi:hypothetical protein
LKTARNLKRLWSSLSLNSQSQNMFYSRTLGLNPFLSFHHKFNKKNIKKFEKLFNSRPSSKGAAEGQKNFISTFFVFVRTELVNQQQNVLGEWEKAEKQHSRWIFSVFYSHHPRYWCVCMMKAAKTGMKNRHRVFLIHFNAKKKAKTFSPTTKNQKEKSQRENREYTTVFFPFIFSGNKFRIRDREFSQLLQLHPRCFVAT